MSNLKANDFWRPRQQYYASDRIKTLILYEDKFYLCNDSHTSGDIFDATKFTLVAGGGAGGGSLEPVGNWDIASSTTNGVIVESTITLTEPYDAFISDGLTVLSGGAMTYPFVGPYSFFSAATTPTVINDFSTTKWFTVDIQGYHLITLHDTTNITNPITDILQPLANNTLDNNRGIYIIVGAFFGDTICTVSYNDPTYSYITALENNVVNMTGGAVKLAFGINTTLGKGYVDNFIDPIYEFDLPSDIFEGVADLQFSAGGLYGSVFGNGATVISFPDQVNKHPITQMREEIVVVPPVGANDGELWNVTSTGTYNGKDLKNNDSVIFYNSLEEIVAITHPDTSAIVIEAINTALDENGQIAVAIDRILAAKGFNSYGGTWNFGGQYDGSLNFSYYFSANYSNNFFQATGGNYIESDGLYYSVVRDATADLTNEVTFDLILPNISNNNNHKLVVDIRDSGSFNDTSIADKFATFTFRNLDTSGFDNTQIEVSVTHSYGSAETFTFVIQDLLSIGEKIHFSLTTTGVSAFKGNGNFIGAYSTNFANNTAAVYVGYGKDSNSLYQPSFVLTQGSKDVILPPLLERKNVTYKATNTDGYSIVYGKTIKEDDLVTFIGTGPSEDILVESVADLSLPAIYGQLPITIADGESHPTTVNVTTVESFDIVSRNIYVYNSILIDYTASTVPSSGGVLIFFNIDDAGVNTARNYKVGDIFQVIFDTSNGFPIESVTFYHPHSGGSIIGTPGTTVTISSGKITTYTFSVMRDTNNAYNTKIVCIGKMEL